MKFGCENVVKCGKCISVKFATKLHDFTKLKVLFSTVLINFPNSKVCLIGEWSINTTKFNLPQVYRVIVH